MASTSLSNMSLLAGGGVLLVGAVVLWFRSRRVEPDTFLGRFTVQTRLSIVIVLAVLGYHLIAWGAPGIWGTGAAVAFPQMWWPWVVGFGAAWIGLSLLNDSMEGPPSS